MTQNNDWKHLREFGYAPGNYMIFNCMGCHQMVDLLDKRAVTCRTCAEGFYLEQQKLYENFNLLAVTQEVCEIIGHTKDNQSDIMLSLMEEAGETATEIKIAKGLKKGPPGVDGVVGEAVDTILCALDVIYTEHGSLNDPHIKKVFHNKLMKWKNKYSKPA